MTIHGQEKETDLGAWCERWRRSHNGNGVLSTSDAVAAALREMPRAVVGATLRRHLVSAFDHALTGGREWFEEWPAGDWDRPCPDPTPWDELLVWATHWMAYNPDEVPAPREPAALAEAAVADVPRRLLRDVMEDALWEPLRSTASES